ncbi:monooxygenase [Photobacterium aquae]|uniref:Monooxygenase n=1 Tax=Photobacterium aquae TaxID=1195763 RepID=A0A0J1GWN5_9GAMM|nr:monooxygenase [Photobacterium aquae]KLV04021.1 monooxygenase [Photobacterium aquae]
MKLLQVDFPFNGPFGEEMAAVLTGLAESINQEPGFVWKIWTESEQNKLGGGIYLFVDQASAERYLAMHTARLQQMGIDGIRGRIFDVNPTLTTVNHGPVA